ncbi:MAG: hypothetical protein LAO22_22375, partial [Acidobacteriia bacterium]|nr:hypothetical protein [Terriglobia bacterium]
SETLEVTARLRYTPALQGGDCGGAPTDCWGSACIRLRSNQIVCCDRRLFDLAPSSLGPAS